MIANIIIWWAGAVLLMAVLAAMSWLAGTALYVLSERACKQILRYRRLSYLRFWTDNLERSGLLPMDRYYRDISQGQKPADVNQAEQWAAQAQSAERAAATKEPRQ